TLGAVLAFLAFSTPGGNRRWALCLIAAAAAVFSKEQGAMTAGLLFFYVALFEQELSLERLFRRRSLAAVFRATWPAIAVCGSLVTMSMRMAATWVPGGTSRWSYLLTQPFALLHYALTFFLPLNLSADTDWQPISNIFDDRVFAGILFVVCALWTAV